jgi:hypothetical protein
VFQNIQRLTGQTCGSEYSYFLGLLPIVHCSTAVYEYGKLALYDGLKMIRLRSCWLRANRIDDVILLDNP